MRAYIEYDDEELDAITIMKYDENSSYSISWISRRFPWHIELDSDFQDQLSN